MKSSVYFNGELVGGHIYGYTDFYVDLTGKLKEGTNEVKVIADNSQFPNSRWYSGSGIYRDVYLHTAGDEYILPDGIRVTTRAINPTKVQVQVKAQKKTDTAVRVMIQKDGETVAQGIGEDLILEIPNAKLWSAETPELYEITAELPKGDQVVDTLCNQFGIRTLAWDAKKGFQINGKTVNFRGGCVHHDHGFIGAAEFDAVCERRVRIMKQAGFNAVRIAHHPASKAMLRACDKLGMYVMNETFDTWLGLKNPYDYAMYFRQEWRGDVEAMVRLSYNHPSVVMYCIGNEVNIKNAEEDSRITRDMVALCHKLDITRPVTNALNPLMSLGDNPENPEKNRDTVVNPREMGEEGELVGSKLANTLVSVMPVAMKLIGNEKAIK